MQDIERELKRLKSLDIIYIVFLVAAGISIYLNYLEKKDLLNGTNEHESMVSTIKVILLVAFLISYLYILYDKYTYNHNDSEAANNLDMGASILFILGTIILIYIEIKGEGIVDIV